MTSKKLLLTLSYLLKNLIFFILILANRSKINSGTTNSGQFCSSDSDADVGDELFVSMRRKRTSSNEYDGEPSEGPSDA